MRVQETKPAPGPQKPAVTPVPTTTLTQKPVALASAAVTTAKQPVMSEDSQLDGGKHMLRIKRSRRVIRTGPVSAMGLPDLRIPGYGYTAPVVPYNGSPTQAHTGTTYNLSSFSISYPPYLSPFLSCFSLR